jgi:hypothetical protein
MQRQFKQFPYCMLTDINGSAVVGSFSRGLAQGVFKLST